MVVTELNGVDRAIFDELEQKFQPLKAFSAPIADKEFKSAMSEHSSNLTSLMQEVKYKRKSFNRRVREGDDTPPLVAAIDELIENIKAVQHIVRCYLDGSVAVHCFRCNSLFFDMSLTSQLSCRARRQFG